MVIIMGVLLFRGDGVSAGVVCGWLLIWRRGMGL